MSRKKIRHFTFLTDFGMKDPYIAEMKGKIYSAIPDAVISDLSNEIEPQNIIEGSLFLEAIWDYWNLPSIHIAVIDPGVGTNRDIIVVRDKFKYLICPDNGLATFIVSRERATVRKLNLKKIESITTISRTFHGRDIMVPAGIEIASGRNWLEITEEIIEPVLVKIPRPQIKDRTITGEILYFDRFGNAITNINSSIIIGKKILKAEIEGKRGTSLPFANTYGEVKTGSALCLFGSRNRLELAINCGSARDKLKLKVGDKIKVYLSD